MSASSNPPVFPRPVLVSVMITSQNRCNELRRTLDRLAGMYPSPCEILVTLDGCSDDSAGMIAELHPKIKVFENKSREGSIPSRDRMLRQASGDLVLSLDDDSYPLKGDAIDLIILRFQEDSRLAVLWFPQRSEEFSKSLYRKDFGPSLHTASFSSSGAVIRREVFLELGGYPGFFGHAYEEPDFGLRCVAARWHVRYDTSLVVRHHYSGRNRNELRTHQLHSRNEQWSIWMRCPWPWWPLVSLRRAVGQFLYACKRGPRWMVREPVWWARALAGFFRAWSMRKPVPWAAYRKWMRLLKRPEPVVPVKQTD